MLLPKSVSSVLGLPFHPSGGCEERVGLRSLLRTRCPSLGAALPRDPHPSGPVVAGRLWLTSAPHVSRSGFWLSSLLSPVSQMLEGGEIKNATSQLTFSCDQTFIREEGQSVRCRGVTFPCHPRLSFTYNLSHIITSCLPLQF